MNTITYLPEPLLNSELVIVNNSKKYKQDRSLLNEEHLDRINELRNIYIELDQRSDSGETGLQKSKREIRNELRELSKLTFTDRNPDIFGSMITLIVDRIASRPQFNNYTFINDMKSLAIEHILLYSHGFDTDKQSKISNQYVSAFAYISTIAFNAFVATINKFNKEQKKAKEDFLETQKLIHKDPNCSTIGPDFENAKRQIKLYKLNPDELLEIMHTSTINESTEFWIPADYKITEKEQDFCMKYVHNISIRRNKDC